MRRILTGLLLAIGWLLLLLLGPVWLLWLFICLAGGLGLREYRNLAFAGGPPGIGASWLAGLLPLLAAWTGRPEAVAGGLVVALLLLASHAVFRYGELDNALEFLARSGFGLVYIGFSLSHLVLLRLLDGGVFWLLLLTAVIAASDTGAFYTGTLLGRTRLCPAVSPGKTREGAAGGLLLAVTVAVLLARFRVPAVDPWFMALLAAALSGVGVLGDLLESVLKRSAGVKDSGTLLAGHGGVLDRADSLLLAAPALYYLLYFGLIPN
jgi:phosphatidate cytidylyltransferase